MAKAPSSGFKVLLVSGVSMLGVKPKAATDKVTNVVDPNYMGLGDDWTQKSATGMQRAELTQTGAYFDSAADAMHAAFKAMSQTVRCLVYALMGNLIGKPFVGVQGLYVGSYKAEPKVGELTMADATYEVIGQIDRGLIVQDWATKTADWNTGSLFSLAIVRSGSTATATTTPAHGFPIGSQFILTVAGADQSEYNGRQTATVTGASTVTFAVSGTPTTPATGTITGGVTLDYTLDPTNVAIPITSNSQANPTVITTPVPHKLTTGDKILISGVSSSSPTINGQQTVTVISSTTFSVAVDTSAGTGGTGGKFVRANSNNGGVGYQSISAASGFSGYVGTIQHSDDDSSYSTLVAFANSVAVGDERKTASGTVKRYVRFDGNVTGTGSIKVFSGFKRNPPQ